jgi:hypothetical protein
MTIPDRVPKHRTAPRSDIIAATLLALATAACGAADAPPADPATADIVAQPDALGSADCLVLAWQEQEAPDRDFDRAHDRADGGAISCATGTTASRFEAALAAIREAAASGDKGRLLDQLGIPLLYIDARGQRRELTRAEAVDEVFDELFSPETIALLERVKLEDLTVVSNQGAFVELGAIWLVVDKRGGEPRIATVNAQALGEAAEAARRAAQEGRTAPAPMQS